jgi:hypothetical protein
VKRLTVLAVAALAVAALALAACPGAGTTGPDGATDTTAALAGGVDDELPLVMAATLEELVTVNHTFGQGPPPFTQYLIQSHTDVDAGPGDTTGARRPLTTAERRAIEEAIDPLGSVRWIDDPAEWRTDDLRPVVAGSAILGVGEPTVDGGSALVPVSLWCGGLCGTWLTYRLDMVHGAWRVAGTEGPITIA